MNRTLLCAALLVIGVLPACGGSGAALQATVYPGDTRVTGRRLESLARDFERDANCTPEDTIVITGLAPGVYHAEGCAHSGDYMIACRPGTSTYGPREVCSWTPFEDLNAHAARDFRCDPDALDVQIVSADVRAVSGCGYRASYQLQCAGTTCGWVLAGRIEGGAASGVDQGGGSGGGYTY